ncbi:MAG: mannose-1-phosphate guanylyltransferase/mannose-6-phosphate isomerase [Patescibacteria group bacterium]
MHSIILCGGSGTRLWPLSRKNYPKQFIDLCGDKSLLQETYARMKKIIPGDNIYLVTNKENYFNVLNQLKEAGESVREEKILTEPASLNTAPAITYAMKALAENFGVDPDEPVVILPSDHHIADQRSFEKVISKAMQETEDNIGTIGITPDRPDTGFGYIKKGEKEGGYYKVEEFKEKPDLKTAQKYFESGEYVWNSGIYIFNIKTFARELKKHSPDTYSVLAKDFPDFINNFSSMPKISLDYAISEKSDRMVVFEGSFGWSDIGSFDRLAELSAGRSNKAKHIRKDSENVFTYSMNDRLIVTSGVSDLIVVENMDSILVQKKGESENVKKVVDHLKENECRELYHNLIVHEPWGKYEVLIENENLKVKKITMRPGGKLESHFHYHRAEHWIITRGVAKITKNKEEIYLNENESTFIPNMTTHELENTGKIDLEIIEVLTGSYLEEDDVLTF